MNKLLDIKDIKGHAREYLEWKKISLHIKKISFDIHDDIHSKISFHIHNT
jgi:hypothetical protein